MTWVVATAFPVIGIMLADIRVSVQGVDGQIAPLTSIGIRKIRTLDMDTIAGFSGDIPRAWKALDRLKVFMEGSDEDDLRTELQEWLQRETAEPSIEVAPHVEILLLRAFPSQLPNGGYIPMTIGCHVRLPDRTFPNGTVRQFTGVAHVGSGSDMPSYAAAVEKAKTETMNLVNMHLTMSQQAGSEADSMTMIARIVAKSWAEGVIVREPIPSVSFDVEVCVIGGGLIQCTSLHFQGTSANPVPPTPIATTLEDLERLAREELGGALSGLALIGNLV